jgi:uncharacterized OB-fold protein
MAAEYEKPLPVIDGSSRPWWEAAKRHELLIQTCDHCGQAIFPPAPICPRCRSVTLTYVPVSGRGSIWTWTVFHKSYFKGFGAEVPYAVTIVELEEGPRLWTQIVGAASTELRIGLPVAAVFEDVTDDVTLVKFRLVENVAGEDS